MKIRTILHFFKKKLTRRSREPVSSPSAELDAMMATLQTGGKSTVDNESDLWDFDFELTPETEAPPTTIPLIIEDDETENEVPETLQFACQSGSSTRTFHIQGLVSFFDSRGDFVHPDTNERFSPQELERLLKYPEIQAMLVRWKELLEQQAVIRVHTSRNLICALEILSSALRKDYDDANAFPVAKQACVDFSYIWKRIPLQERQVVEMFTVVSGKVGKDRTVHRLGMYLKELQEKSTCLHQLGTGIERIAVDLKDFSYNSIALRDILSMTKESSHLLKK